MLSRALAREGHDCVILSRTAWLDNVRPGIRQVRWDGRTLGSWAREVDDADVVINLAGRSVDCRYHERNLTEMMNSRVESTRIIGQAIARSKRPPCIWLQAGTATIYAHRYEQPNDEATGLIGGTEPGVPVLWRKSIEIAQAWEAELAAAPTPRTRKVVLRSAMTMSPNRGGVFHVLARHCRLGFGQFGGGRQYVSWIHEHDFVEAIRFLVGRDDLAGAFNVCSPHPLPNRDFISGLNAALGRRFAVPVPRWAVEIGTFFLRTESELVLKSRRVVPGRLLENGFAFRFPDWSAAVADLVQRWKSGAETDSKHSTP